MITGFNTDVKHKNRVFHIQTEDKGEANPYVESLVYVGGEILATKKTSYAEVLDGRRDDLAVQDLMEQQHRTMIAAIQRGRFDGPNGTIQIPEGMSPTTAHPPPAPPGRVEKPEKAERIEKAEKAEKVEKADRPSKAAKDDKGDATAPPGTKSPLPPAAKSPAPAADRSLDQMVLAYLASDEVPDEVDLTLSPTPEFVAGRSVQTKLKATSGSPPRPLAGASVQVRILSTSARALTAYQGKTAADGSCYISFMIPTFPNGNAVAVIRVTGPNASSEIQYTIKKK